MEKENETREYQKAFDYLRNLIAGGELTIGSRLPTERDLSQKLSIGRNSTREALRMMENMGLIESRRGSGNYIVGNMSQTISGIIDMMLILQQTTKEEICSFRRNMDKAVCLSILETGNIIEYEDELSRLLEREETSKQLDEQVEADKEFHYTLMQATKNRFWISISEAIAAVYRRWIDTVIHKADENTKLELWRTHKDIYEALRNKDMIACEKAIDQHYNLVDKEI